MTDFFTDGAVSTFYAIKVPVFLLPAAYFFRKLKKLMSPTTIANIVMPHGFDITKL